MMCCRCAHTRVNGYHRLLSTDETHQEEHVPSNLSKLRSLGHEKPQSHLVCWWWWWVPGPGRGGGRGGRRACTRAQSCGKIGAFDMK